METISFLSIFFQGVTGDKGAEGEINRNSGEKVIKIYYKPHKFDASCFHSKNQTSNKISWPHLHLVSLWCVRVETRNEAAVHQQIEIYPLPLVINPFSVNRTIISFNAVQILVSMTSYKLMSSKCATEAVTMNMSINCVKDINQTT